MSFYYTVQTNDARLVKDKRRHRYYQSRKQRMNLDDDSDSSSYHYQTYQHQRRKRGANKKNAQISQACTEEGISDTKLSNQSDKYLSKMLLMSSDSEMDLDIAIQYWHIDSNDNQSNNNVHDLTIPHEQIQENLAQVNIIEQCHKTEPDIETKMMDDLSKALDYPSKNDLSQIVQCIQDLPFDKKSHTFQINESIKSFRRKRNFDTKDLKQYLQDIRNTILDRCSYGFLIINKDKDQCLAARNCRGKHRWSAPKGHLRIKGNGQWEKPFEAAVREMNEEIKYWDPESEQWGRFDKHLVEKCLTYLECVVKSTISGYRRIGLFLVCLQDDLYFHPKDGKEIDDVRWFGIQDQINPKEFYTIYPFVQYLRSHPEILHH